MSDAPPTSPATLSGTIKAAVACVGFTLGVAHVAARMAPEDRSLLLIAAERIAPPDRIAPSAWAEKNIKLTAEMGAWPGAFSANVKPHQRDSMDIAAREPDRRGVIHPKCSQIGATLLELIETAGDQVADPGPTLVICADDLKSKEYCEERFVPLLKSSGRLARITEEAGKDKKIVGYGVHFPGGKVTFAWATSETRLIGTPYRRVKVDDATKCMEAYAMHCGGDLFTAAEERTSTYRAVRKINFNGHPRGEHEGLWLLYITYSDQRVWTIDCPQPDCRKPVPMRWKMVGYRGTGPDGRPDPMTAELRCPHCSKPITESQRCRALWPSRLGTGGSGRYESELSDEEARRRPYIGLHTTRLADPDISVVELARKLHACGNDESKIRDVMTMSIGEPVGPTGARVLDDIHLNELAAKEVPSDVEFVTAGVDVQKGPTGETGPPGLYLVMTAWARSGTAFVVDARTMVGFDALNEYLAGFSVRVPTMDPKVFRVLPVACCAIDVAYLTSLCLNQCRSTIYTRVGGEFAGSRIRLVGLRYVNATVGPDRPWAEPSIEKRIWKERPELGPVDYIYLHRHSWVDRTYRRFAEKRVRMLCAEPPGWRGHLNANHLAPVRKRHEWEPERLEWDKAKNVPDDYARAFDYGEVAASLKCGLEQIHLRDIAPTAIQTFKFGGRRADDEGGW